MQQTVADTGNKSFKCLVADDSEFARKNIARIIAAAGGAVVGEASNGGEAVDLYSRLNPAVVFLDITMPVLDGIETLRRIMEIDKKAKVIMITSIGHKEMVWKALCLGAKHYITKPYSEDYVSRIIMSVVEKGDDFNEL